MITIIVLLILAVTSISLVINSGIIFKTEETVFKTEIEQYNEELKVSVAHDTMNNLGIRDKFNVRRSSYNDEDSFTEAMKQKIPSFKSKYANKLEIKEDSLNYIGEDEQERTWLAQTISVAGMLKISYVYENGKEAAPTYQKVITDGSYEVESPKIEGYEPDHSIVMGEIEGDINITVTYYGESQGLDYELLDDGTYTVAGIGTFTGENLVIPKEYNGKNITQIKSNAFEGNTTIKTLVIPETIQTLKTNAFYYCYNLKNININAEKMEGQVFEACWEIESVIFGKNVKSIGNRTFWRGSSKLEKIEIYTEQANINSYTFEATNLKEIKVNADNSKYSVIDGVLYSKDLKKIYMYPPAKEGNFTIPDTVEEIGAYAFYANNKLTNLIITDKIKTVGTEAFYASGLLEEININAKTIGSWTFELCPNLKKVTMGKNVNTISGKAFARSTNIKEFNYLGTKEQWNNVTKQDGWTRDSSITQVICLDGTVDV